MTATFPDDTGDDEGLVYYVRRPDCKCFEKCAGHTRAECVEEARELAQELGLAHVEIGWTVGDPMAAPLWTAEVEMEEFLEFDLLDTY